MLLLQWPPLVAESRQRSARLRKLLGATAPSGDTPVEMLALVGGRYVSHMYMYPLLPIMPQPICHSPHVTAHMPQPICPNSLLLPHTVCFLSTARLKQFKWATWLVQSRVLTVLGPEGRGHKLMIPFLDMFNHKGSSPHYLTGRTDGSLKVVAGGRGVSAGEQICIVYGEATTSNAEFLGHYGFVDADCGRADHALLAANPQAHAALAMSTLEEDEALRQNPDEWDRMRPNEKLAVDFRMAMKRQLAKMEGVA